MNSRPTAFLCFPLYAARGDPDIPRLLRFPKLTGDGDAAKEDENDEFIDVSAAGV